MAIIHQFKPRPEQPPRAEEHIPQARRDRKVRDIRLVQQHSDTPVEVYVEDEFLFRFTPAGDAGTVMQSMSHALQAIQNLFGEEDDSIRRPMLLLREILAQGLWYMGKAYAEETPDESER